MTKQMNMLTWWGRWSTKGDWRMEISSTDSPADVLNTVIWWLHMTDRTTRHVRTILNTAHTRSTAMFQSRPVISQYQRCHCSAIPSVSVTPSERAGSWLWNVTRITPNRYITTNSLSLTLATCKFFFTCLWSTGRGFESQPPRCRVQPWASC